MNFIWCLLILQQSLAFAAPAPLSFSARIQDEALAEEAIDLLHCLSERKGIAWELGPDNAPAPSVRLVEKNGLLEGIYEGERRQAFSLKKNGWRMACNELSPVADAEIASASPASFLTEAPATLPQEKSPAKKWLIAGAAVLVMAGGFMAWRSGRPDHRSLRME
ncbi:MAG: hypothetical protein EOP11_09425 [Proteobacteria bacterium]|nr:MAG: hypothetical protein EOP11_09425 [Pseudomonadota bacterium]